VRSNGDFFRARALPSPPLFPIFLLGVGRGKGEGGWGAWFGCFLSFRFMSFVSIVSFVLFAFVLIVDFWFSLLFFGFGCLFSLCVSFLFVF